MTIKKWLEVLGGMDNPSMSSIGERLVASCAEKDERIAGLEATIRGLQDDIANDGPAKQNLTAHLCAKSALNLYEQRCALYREALVRISNYKTTMTLDPNFGVNIARAALDAPVVKAEEPCAECGGVTATGECAAHYPKPCECFPCPKCAPKAEPKEKPC